MRLVVAGFRACLIFCLLLTSLPAFAFDEDHHEVINGARLHFRVRGTDKAHPYLVILHGGPGFSAHMFYPWGASLEKIVNVVYLDQRGSGESARLTVANTMAPAPAEIKGYTVANLLGDIEGVRQALKVEKWYVLGHSWGGMLGLEYVVAHPDHVLGYVHMDGLVSVPRMQDAMLDGAARRFAAARPKDGAGLAQVKQLRALPPGSPFRFFGALGLAMGPAGLYFAGDQKAGFAGGYRQIGAAVAPYHLTPAALAPASEPGAALIANDHFLTRDDTPLLAKVTVPTLILNGKQDGLIPPSEAEAAHAAIKGSQIAGLDDCGHFPFFEQPVTTTAAVLAFVTLKAPDKPGHTTTLPEPFVGTFSDVSLPGIDVSTLNGKPAIVRWTVDDQGEPTNIAISSSCGNKAVDQAFVQAIRAMRFKPGTIDGQLAPFREMHTFILSR